MKQHLLHLQVLLLVMLFGVPLGARADREVNQLQFGKQTIEVASDEVITFYDFKGTGDISSSSSSNSHSLTVFKPAEAGKSVQISFEEIDIYPDGTTFPAYMNVYSGDPDADGTFVFATATNEVTTSTALPEGNILKTMGGKNKTRYTSSNETFVSGESDGSLAVGFLYKYASACSGWKATVKVVKLENQTVTGAGSSYDNVTATITKKQNVDLATAFVTTTGVMNPDKVTSISFNLTQNEGMVDPTALKLFYGDNAISATVSEEGSGYKFALSQPLSEGTNNFYVRGDILGTAAVGAKVQLDITKITTEGHPDGVTPFTAATSIAVENPAIVIMSSTPQTITVSETPLQFYDEGGKEGGIVSKTNGKVTFLSGVEGKKVMVDFTNNSIWHGSLYNQELRIYNGQEVSEANLIKTLQKGDTGKVCSTAADGSLTVVLFSDASNDVAADGFEAEVSLFTPQPMVASSVETSAASTETVCAGDKNQVMMKLNVKTAETEPALVASKFVFSAKGASANATHATLYFTGNSGEMSTTEGNKVGEVDITADAFEILTTSKEVVLAEGDNYFWLTYDISENVQNGDKVAAQFVSAAFTNATSVDAASDAIVAERLVDNLVYSYSDMGSVTKKVNGEITFRTKPKSEYSNYYEAGTDDRVNVFIPMHEGMVCQLDFSSFDLYYYSYSTSSSAKFTVYNGTGTSGEVLWKATEKDDYSNGPGKVIRSTAADGALTVVFNANQSYTSSSGWTAVVSEYQPQPMVYNSTIVSQASTEVASIGGKNEQMLSFNVNTTGDQSKLTFDGVTLNLKDTQSRLDKAYLYYVGSQDDAPSADATPIAVAEVDKTTATLTLSPATAMELAEGDNIFYVNFDISSDAEEDSSVDAAIVSVKISGEDKQMEKGDPDGQRILKNQMMMTEGNHGIVELGLGQTVNLYDDGGPEGDGADGVTATITFAPTGDADCIKLTDKGISFNYTSHLYIYKGGEALDENQIIDLSGSSAKFDPIISDADVDGGKITIKYIGKGSWSKPNFAMLVEGYKKTDVVVTGVTTEDISVSEVLKGQTDTKMLKIMVEAKGDLTPAALTAFDITGIGGEAVENYHIYQTGTTTTFSANEEFSESYSITKSGTYYFWLTYDVKSDAEVGQTAAATLNGITVDGKTISVEDPATATITVASGKSGTYTVGQGGDYATIQGAIDDIGTLGMEGPVTLKIKAGEYNEKVRIPNIKGMGAVNTLTLESESGERDVKIYHNSYTAGGYSDDQHKKDYGVVTLYEANYVTLKNLEITTTDLNYKAVVMVKDESRHATIDNCYLHTDIYASTSGDGPALVGHTIIDEENKNNDYLTVKNCLLEGGKYGVYMGGTSFVALPKEVGGIIEGNTFKNNGRFMLYSYDELGAKIRNNTFIIDDANVKMSNGVIDINVRDENAEATEITGNFFNLTSANTLTAIYVRQMEGTEAAPAVIANNVVNLASANASCTPFKFSGAKQKYVNIAYNTFRMTGTNGGAVFWASSALADGYGNVSVVNNIIQSETSGYAVNLYNDANLGTDKINFQNNVIYTAGENFFRASSSTEGDFATFVEKTGATACVNKQVSFLSESILEPANDLEGDLLTAKALAYVTTDISGKERPAENITIGAYEFDPNANDAPVMAEGYPQVKTHLDGNASVAVKTDLAAKLFYIVKKADETAPTIEELQASETSQDINANAETIIDIDNLEDEQQYVVYFLPVSLRGVVGEPSQTESFLMEVTPPETLKPEAMAFINNSDTEETVASGTEVSLMAMVTVDETTAPYVLTWMDQKHNVLKTETFEDVPEDLFTVKTTPTECTDYIFLVTDNAGKADTATVRAIVTGEAVTATFETLYVDPEDGFWMGLPEGGSSTFVSGSYKFDNGYMPEWSFWYNFGYTNSTSTSFDGKDYVTQQWNNAAGGGYDGSENYLVAYPQGGKITVLNNPDGDQLRGMYVTNDAWNVYAYTVGDSYTKNAETGNDAFDKGDWCKLTITADNGNSVDVYLADYQSENADDRYYLNTWQWVDLSSLGTVKSLQFFITSSRKNEYGMTTPGYFCIDNFNGTRPEKEAPEQSVNEKAEIALADLFTLDTSGTVVYALADGLPSDIKATVTLDAATGTLTIEGTDAEQFTVVVSSTQKGKTQFLKIPVSVAEATNGDNSALLSEIDEAKKLLQFSMTYYDENNTETPDDAGKALVDAIRNAESLAETATSQKKLDKALEDLKNAENDYANALMEYELAESENILSGADPADELAAEIQRLYDTQDVVREDYSNQPKHIKNYSVEIDNAQKAYLRKAINDLMPEAQAVSSNPEVKKAIDAANNALENESSEGLFDALNGLLDALKTTTGIRGVEAAETDAPVYNMAGQRVSKHSKGVVIKNGKKYVK